VWPVDGSYLYKVGSALKPLEGFTQHTPWKDAWFSLFVASAELQTFINESVYRVSVRSSRENADKLLAILKEQSDLAVKEENADKSLSAYEAYRLTNALRDFQTVLTAEFRLTPLFLVTPKRGYDLGTLVYNGNTLFPDSLATKVPEAVEDLKLGARCLAFEMLTAAAFHFHRANEAVLRKYWEAKLPRRAHPGNKTLSDYLRALGQARKGSPKVKASLRDIKNLYRNPVVHPEYLLKDVDEAIALLGSIHTAIVQMLAEIPEPPKPTTAASSAVPSP
jgi:hypothetical protein